MDIYRDPTEGTLARRRELVRDRLGELALLPHAVRRVVVARRARTAAAIAALLAGAVLIAAANVPALAAMIARTLPGLIPAPLASCVFATWLIALIVYAGARARHEHQFAVAMSRVVLPSDDAAHDVERLSHERPDEVARAMADRLEVRSAALPVAAAAVVLPATLAYLGLAARAHGWPRTRLYEQLLAGHGGTLLAIAVAGVVAAIVMTRRAARQPAVAPFAVAIAAATLVFAVAWASWAALAAAVIAGTVAYLSRRLRVERERIETEDPAAGSELFTWRGALRRARAATAAFGRAARRLAPARAWATAAIVLSVVVIAGGELHERRAPRRAPVLPGVPIVTPEAHAHAVALDDLALPGAGTLEIPVHGNGTPVELPAISGLKTIPAGWHAVITLATRAGSARAAVFPNDAPVEITDQPRRFELCATHDQPIRLRVETAGDITLLVSATLDLGPCR